MSEIIFTKTLPHVCKGAPETDIIYIISQLETPGTGSPWFKSLYFSERKVWVTTPNVYGIETLEYKHTGVKHEWLTMMK